MRLKMADSVAEAAWDEPECSVPVPAGEEQGPETHIEP